MAAATSKTLLKNHRVVRPALRLFLLCLLPLLLLCGCKVTLISGYNQIVAENAVQMQQDFNVHAARLLRAIGTFDNNKDQAFTNFQDYYDHLNADTVLLHGCINQLGQKSKLVSSQLQNLITVLARFEDAHFRGLFTDGPGNVQAFQTNVNGINNAFASVIFLQEKLKAAE